MASQFEYNAKLSLATSQLKAASTIEEAGLLEQAASLHWISLRTFLFASLTVRNIRYSSTRDALVFAISSTEVDTVGRDLMFSYILGTMAEWDEHFRISETQLDLLKIKCESVRRHFASGKRGD